MILKILWFPNIIFILYIIDYSMSVPPLYCLQPLNGSDCQGKPTPVFSYYKPGSRCEIETWRGCPTMNKFDDEYLCSHFCIFNFLGFQDVRPTNLYQKQDMCQKIFDGSKCTNETASVFTYNSRTQKCEHAIWRGCYTDNIFIDEASCESICKPVKTDLNFESKLIKLSHGDAGKIKSILNLIVTDNTEVINETTLSTSVNTKIEEITKDVPQLTAIDTNSISRTTATGDSTNITIPTNVDDISETTTNINTVEPTTNINTVEPTTNINTLEPTTKLNTVEPTTTTKQETISTNFVKKETIKMTTNILTGTVPNVVVVK